MNEFKQLVLNEYKRLVTINSYEVDNNSNLLTTDFVVTCNDNAHKVIINIVEVLVTIDWVVLNKHEWPNINEWHDLLPHWFDQACAIERNDDEKKQFLELWNNMTDNDKKIYFSEKKPWSLKNWLFYFTEEERDWFLKKISLVKNYQFTASIESIDCPFHLGSFKWLVEASGGINLKEMEEI
jgi:hypothetical protein